jgi:lycopene beta-cyclase
VFDVAVIGCGPAGLGFATCAARQGLTVCVIDPVLKKEWHCTYCTWIEELGNSWLNDLTQETGAGGSADLFDKRFADTEVIYNDGSRQALGKRYGRIDGRSLKKMMHAACDRSKRVTFVEAIVNQIDHLDRHTEISYHRSGETSCVRARVAVDSSGHYSQFLDYATSGSAAAPHCGGQRKWQSFYGEELEFDEPHGYDLVSRRQRCRAPSST